MKAIILVGGLGTRLRTVLRDEPKCMAPIGGRPFLEYQLVWLRSWGIRDVTLCLGYKGRRIIDHFGNGSEWSLSLGYAIEKNPLGTAGALKNAESFIRQSSFLVLNGDSLLAVDLDALVRFHQKRGALATLALARVPTSHRYGTVQLDSRGHILTFLEKRAAVDRQTGGSKKPQFVNGGVYVLTKKVLKKVSSGRKVSLEQEIFPQLVGRGFYGFPTTGYFVDIGLPEDYKRAQKELPRRFTLC